MTLKNMVKGIRAAVCDVAFPYRMGAGFAGDVNRMHPAEIEATLIDAAAPPTAYGQAVVGDTVTQGVRPLAVADASDAVVLVIYGVTVRPFPTQQATATNYGEATIGAATPPVSGIIDVLRSGLIMVKLNANVTPPKKFGRVFVWCAATAGDHVQGGYETEASAGNTVQLVHRYTYNGGVDANNVVELSANV